MTPKLSAEVNKRASKNMGKVTIDIQNHKKIFIDQDGNEIDIKTKRIIKPAISEGSDNVGVVEQDGKQESGESQEADEIKK